MEKKIHQLSETVINKIAAGEVVESPASVVKELVDNAIDASSTKIVVRVKNGGFLAISVEDNGDGMGEEDLKSCILRHATSKIFKAEDLFALSTMGFRGEALSSICAVSKTIIVSAVSGAGGYEISVAGGKVLSMQEKAKGKGTSIYITDLFFNTPARKKFQKSSTSSTKAIIKLISQFSLAYLNVRFQLYVDEKLILNLNTYQLGVEKSLSQRVKELFNEGFLSELKWIDHKDEKIHIYGLLSYPKFYKKNRAGQYLYVNKRCISSPTISDIVKAAYGTRICEHSYPVFILFFELVPSDVDFNVHPQKKEVRLNNIEAVETQIYNCVKNAFERQIPSPKFNLSITQQLDYHFKAPEFSKKQESFDLPFENRQKVEFDFLKVVDRYCFVESKSLSQRLNLNQSALLIADLKEIYFLIVFSTLLLEGSFQIESQSLLVPIILELSQDKIIHIQEKIPYFNKCGFDLSIGGERTVFVSKIPAFFSYDNVKDLVEQFCVKDHIEDMKKLKIKKIALTMSQVKHLFTKEEARLLLKNLVYAKDPFYSPDGKPTLIQCGAMDIHKLFGSKRAGVCLL